MTHQHDEAPITDKDTVQMTGRTYSKFKAAWEALEVFDRLLNLAEFDCMDDKSNEWRSEMIYAREAIAKARGIA